MTETLDSLRVSIPKDQIVALQRYTWPGNVRELRHVIERAVIVSKGPRLLVEPPRARLGTTRQSLRLADAFFSRRNDRPIYLIRPDLRRSAKDTRRRRSNRC